MYRVVGQRSVFRVCLKRNEWSMLGVVMRVGWEEAWQLRVSLEGLCV